METWEPDQIFGKADFPSRKKKDGNEPEEPSPASGRTKKKSDANPALPSQPVKKTGGHRNAQGPIKTLKPDGAFAPKGWQPEQINTDNAKVIRHRSDEAGEKNNGPGQGKPPGRVPARPAGVNAGAGASAFPAQLFRQAALESPETSIRFLRKWLWEKWPPPGGAKSGIDSIEPHDRIFIVLSTLGAKVVQYLFQIMSPRERAEFQKILKRPPRHTQVSTAMVCRAFMDGIKDAYS